jgi:hypothetical protein
MFSNERGYVFNVFGCIYRQLAFVPLTPVAAIDCKGLAGNPMSFIAYQKADDFADILWLRQTIQGGHAFKLFHEFR